MTEAGSPEIAGARIGTYQLLARLTLAEIDAPLARCLLEVPVLGEALSASGGSDALQELRAEYTRLFLMNVHPYESVYLDDSGMLNGATSGAVLGHYREHEFDPPALHKVGAPDHLGLEMQFMAHLFRLDAASVRPGNQEQALTRRADQVHFLEAHLTRWGPIFGRLLSDLAQSLFYNRLGQSIETFLLGELEALAAE